MKNIDLSQAMREGMRRLASGVSVLSNKADDGARHAMTVSSVTSVSAEPPSLLVCVHEQTVLHNHLNHPGDPFVINVLAREQEAISNLCAGREPDECRFSIGDWQQGHDDQPYLADAQAAFFCHSDKIFSYGTHKIVIGKIVKVMVSEGQVTPLIYVDGGYASSHKDQ